MEIITIIENAKLPEVLALFDFHLAEDVPENADHIKVQRESGQQYFIFLDEAKEYFILDASNLQQYSVRQFLCMLLCLQPEVDLSLLGKTDPFLTVFRLKVSTTSLIARAFVLGIKPCRSKLSFTNHPSLKNKLFDKEGLAFPLFHKGELVNLITMKDNSWTYVNANTEGVWNNTVKKPGSIFFAANPVQVIELYQNFIPDDFLCVLVHEKASSHTVNRLFQHAFDHGQQMVMRSPGKEMEVFFLLQLVVYLLDYNVGPSSLSRNGNFARLTLPLTGDFLDAMNKLSDVNYSLRCDILGDEPKKFPEEIGPYFSIEMKSLSEERLEIEIPLCSAHSIRLVELINQLYPVDILLTDFQAPLSEKTEPRKEVLPVAKVKKIPKKNSDLPSTPDPQPRPDFDDSDFEIVFIDDEPVEPEDDEPDYEESNF